jgi:hypothetical protein
MTHPLDHALDNVGRIHRDAALPIVLLDLDSTLFDTAPRNLRILREFAAAHRDHAGLVASIEKMSLGDMGWNVMAALRTAGVADEATLEALKKFWAARFFSDEYLGFDEPVKGAAGYCHALWQAGALLYYLTGRHVGGMELGTLRNLVRHSFPWGSGRTILHLKPNFEEDDEVFKRDAITAIRSLGGQVAAAFENEPANCNLLHDAFPDAASYFLDTVHSPRPDKPHDGAIWIKDFSR